MRVFVLSAVVWAACGEDGVVVPDGDAMTAAEVDVRADATVGSDVDTDAREDARDDVSADGRDDVGTHEVDSLEDVAPDVTDENDAEVEVDAEITEVADVAPEVDVEVREPEPLPAPDAVAGVLTIRGYGALPFRSPAEIDDVLFGPYSIGRELFVADWRVAPDGTRPNIDGLGPLANATSCAACHPAGGRAPALNDDGSTDVGVLFRLASFDGDRWVARDPVFGGQLQPLGVAPVSGEAIITWAAEAPPAYVSSASPRPRFSIETFAGYGTLTTSAGPRLAPQLLGMGLLELVAEDDILAYEDPDDRDGDGISGRAARLGDENALGRFGWKAVHATLGAQSSAAFAGDIGISSPLHADDCTVLQDCGRVPHGGAPEIDQAGIDAVDTFQAFLGVPAARRSNDDPVMTAGNALFHNLGCASCHRPSFTTPAVLPAARQSLAGQRFYAYTDLLLHDLGPDLADAIGEGDASPSEWRTPPLWGIGLVDAAPDARYLHDGRATTIDDAIRWHGGEALRAREAYRAASEAERDALIGFVRSL